MGLEGGIERQRQLADDEGERPPALGARSRSNDFFVNRTSSPKVTPRSCEKTANASVGSVLVTELLLRKS